jgi:hypothetical protein
MKGEDAASVMMGNSPKVLLEQEYCCKRADTAQHIRKETKWVFYFKEFSNLTFSALTILGQTLNLVVVSNSLQ